MWTLSPGNQPCAGLLCIHNKPPIRDIPVVHILIPVHLSTFQSPVQPTVQVTMSTHITALASPVASTRSHESDTDCVPAMDDSTIMPSLSLTRQFRESHSPDSPSASIAMLRTAETLDGLARQLTELHDSRLAESDPDIAVRCCCGASVDCPTFAARDRMDAKLKLCGGALSLHHFWRLVLTCLSEIGTALLHRYEALEQKYHHAELQASFEFAQSTVHLTYTSLRSNARLLPTVCAT